MPISVDKHADIMRHKSGAQGQACYILYRIQLANYFVFANTCACT